MKISDASDIKLGSTSVSKVMLGSTEVWTRPSPIPAQYVIQPYIQSTGSSNRQMSYINTGYMPTLTTKIEFKFEYPVGRSNYATYNNWVTFNSWVFTNPDKSAGDMSFGILITPSLIRFLGCHTTGSVSGNEYDVSYRNFVTDNAHHVIEGSFDVNECNVTIDDTPYILSPLGAAWSGLDGTSDTTVPIYLFAGVWGNWDQNPIPANSFVTTNCYYFRIYDNNVAMRDYVPVYDTVTQKYGMYDKVNSTFNISPNGVNFTV